MLVLVDLEWVSNKDGKLRPTQIAAIKVDKNWRAVRAFSEYVSIRKDYFRGRDVALTGYSAVDWKRAKDLEEVMGAFDEFILEGDVICLWSSESKWALTRIYRSTLYREPQSTVVMQDSIDSVLRERGIGTKKLYRIAEMCKVSEDYIPHYALDDVLLMQKLMIELGVGQELLHDGDAGEAAEVHEAAEEWKWVADLRNITIHRTGCPDIAEDAVLQGYESLETFAASPRTKACQCCAKDWRKVINRQSIDNMSGVGFVHVTGSEVFHRKECAYALSGKDIQAFGRYASCIKKGYRPCKICKPASIYDLGQTEEEYERKKRAKETIRKNREKRIAELLNKTKVKKKNTNAVRLSTLTLEKYDVPERVLSNAEINAVKRFVCAKEERTLIYGSELTDRQRWDLVTKSRTDYAFWASPGYKTFHRHDCPKLTALSNVRGFRRYEEAMRAGYRPCKLCKPDSKTDLVLTMPIYCTYIPGETEEDIEEFCDQNGMTHEILDDDIIIRTDVGKWKIKDSTLPYKLYHINKVMSPENADYHLQPHIFLSLKDIVYYIKNHDDVLKKQTEMMKPFVSELKIPPIRT